MQKLKNLIANKLLMYRAIARLLEKPHVAEAWKQATEEERELLIQSAESGRLSTYKVKLWVRNLLNKDCYDFWSIDLLRGLASDLGIEKYWLLKKDELIIAIVEKINYDKSRDDCRDSEVV